MTEGPAILPDRETGRRPRVAAFTMANNEAAVLPRWVAYYGGAIGHDHLLVLDDNSTDGSTDDLPCPVHRLPPTPWKQDWGKTRQQMANAFARAYLAVYDVVIFTDTDEFLVPDPNRFDGLLDYFDQTRERTVMAGLGLNVLHAPDVEGPLDPDHPVLGQRRFVKFAPNMCKPSAKRIPAPWTPGVHGIKQQYTVDRDLWFLHLKYYDIDYTPAVAARRQQAHLELGRGHSGSAWAIEPNELARRHLRWVQGADLTSTPEFDAEEPVLDEIVTQVRPGTYRSTGGRQLDAMERSPLRRLPARVLGLL